MWGFKYIQKLWSKPKEDNDASTVFKDEESRQHTHISWSGHKTTSSIYSTASFLKHRDSSRGHRREESKFSEDDESEFYDQTNSLRKTCHPEPEPQPKV